VSWLVARFRAPPGPRGRRVGGARRVPRGAGGAPPRVIVERAVRWGPGARASPRERDGARGKRARAGRRQAGATVVPGVSRGLPRVGARTVPLTPACLRRSTALPALPGHLPSTWTPAVRFGAFPLDAPRASSERLGVRVPRPSGARACPGIPPRAGHGRCDGARVPGHPPASGTGREASRPGLDGGRPAPRWFPGFRGASRASGPEPSRSPPLASAARPHGSPCPGISPRPGPPRSGLGAFPLGAPRASSERLGVRVPRPPGARACPGIPPRAGHGRCDGARVPRHPPSTWTPAVRPRCPPPRFAPRLLGAPRCPRPPTLPPGPPPPAR
jgi:hypothetical protein